MSSFSDFFAHPESEIAKLFMATDWENSSLGSIATWPALLKTLVKNLMRTPVPSVLWWGPDYVQIYNEAYIPIISQWVKVSAMGRPAKESWADIWNDFTYPDIQRVLTEDDGFVYENRKIPMYYKG